MDECSKLNDHVRIKSDTTSYLNRRLPPSLQLLLCRVHFAWAGYSGEMSGAYDRAEDALITTKLLKDTLRQEAEADRTIAGIDITLIKERTRDGKLVEGGGSYVRLDVKFDGSPAGSVRVWGKRVAGDDLSASVQLSRVERLRLGIEGKKWRWNAE